MDKFKYVVFLNKYMLQVIQIILLGPLDYYGCQLTLQLNAIGYTSSKFTISFACNDMQNCNGLQLLYL